MIRINNIKMPVKHSENDLKKTVYKLYKINENEIKSFEIAGQAIDARKKDNVVFVYAVDISFKFDEETEKKRFENVKNVRKIEKKPVIVLTIAAIIVKILILWIWIQGTFLDLSLGDDKLGIFVVFII